MYQDLLDAIYRASEEDLMMSRMNCHAKNVSSIVLKNTNDVLTRVFLAWPGHHLHMNSDPKTAVVGVHDHRYDIRLKLLRGKVRNIEWKIVEGEDLSHYSYLTKFPNPPEITKLGLVSLEKVRETNLIHDVWLCLKYDTLHSIDCRGKCAWYVKEGVFKQNTTNLITNNFNEESMKSLYNRFSSIDDIYNHVEEWMTGDE